MAWTLDLDDFSNQCCQGTFPLLRAVNKALGRDIPSPVSGCAKPPTPVTPAPVDMTVTPDTGESRTLCSHKKNSFIINNFNYRIINQIKTYLLSLLYMLQLLRAKENTK